MHLKQEAYSEIKNKFNPKMKFDQKVYIVVISFNIDNMPFCVVFPKLKILMENFSLKNFLICSCCTMLLSKL